MMCCGHSKVLEVNTGLATAVLSPKNVTSTNYNLTALLELFCNSIVRMEDIDDEDGVAVLSHLLSGVALPDDPFGGVDYDVDIEILSSAREEVGSSGYENV